MQMKEYGDFSGDAAFLESKLDLLERIASVFLDRRASEHGGAVRRLPDRLGYWNFYEWAKTLDGRSIHKETADADLPAEAPLTAFLAMACRDLGAIFELCAAKNGEKADVFAKKPNTTARRAASLQPRYAMCSLTRTRGSSAALPTAPTLLLRC